jgi:xanthine permease
MTDISSGAYSDPNATPPMGQAIPLGIQHVLAMFASNVTPSIIVAGAAGFAFGGEDMTYLVQMAMLFAGVATLFQTIGMGPIGARLPIMQGTSFAFVSVLVVIAANDGMAAMFGAIIIGGIFHFGLGSVIGRIRFLFPPLVTGLVILTIGLNLVAVGIKYAAGGAADFQMASDSFGSLAHWLPALTVVFVALGFKFWTKGTMSAAAILVGLVAGYIVAIPFGLVSFGGVGNAGWVSIPKFMPYGFEFNIGAIIAVVLISIVSAIETVGDANATTKGGAGREATDEEITGATYADGLGSAIAGVFGGLPNTSFSQNAGIVAMTGVMSRHVVTISALILIGAGLIPKLGAIVSSMPLPVLGGGVIVMFGMIISAGLNMLSDVEMNRRNMVIMAVSLSVGLGLSQVPTAVQHVGGTLNTLLISGLLPTAVIAIVMNLVLPKGE